MAIDTTVAGADADSYIDVAAADALANADLGPERDLWLAVATTTEQKENALQRATREIDGYLRSGWLRYDVSQALLFPRAIDFRADEPFIPMAVQRATYEQATYVLKNAAVLDGAATRTARNLQSFSQPNISGTQPVPDDGANVMSPAALHYLEGFRRAGGSRGIRSIRVSAGPAVAW